MKTLLLINSSARSGRSITRRLTSRFAGAWTELHPNGKIISRDVGLNPPPFVDETWISAAFSSQPVPTDVNPLATSDALVDELFRADAVVIGAPMYNFGMPAALKAYVDQIVRAGRTFDMNGHGEWPYRPLIPNKPLVLITSAGAAGYEPQGTFAHFNYLDGHLHAVFRFIGLTDISQVHVGSEEHQGDEFRRMLAEAERRVEALATRVSGLDRAGLEIGPALAKDCCPA